MESRRFRTCPVLKRLDFMLAPDFMSSVYVDYGISQAEGLAQW